MAKRENKIDYILDKELIEMSEKVAIRNAEDEIAELKRKFSALKQSHAELLNVFHTELNPRHPMWAAKIKRAEKLQKELQ